MSEASDHEAGMRDRPIGEVVQRLTEDFATLVKTEIQLARLETADRLRALAPGALLAGAGIVALLCAAGALTAAVVLGMAIVLDGWLAALLTAGLMGLVAFVLGATGRNRIKGAGAPVPAEAIESIEEDVSWNKTQARSARR